MKKISTIALMMVFALSLAFVGCKKGENDPLISLKSRDGRITGTWVLSKVDKSDDITITDGGANIIINTTETYDGTSWSTSSAGITTKVSFSYEVTIEKDGTWSSTQTTDGDTEEASGYWQWSDSKKNKTGIVVANTLWTIDQLKNKELITINNTFYKDTDSDGDGTETTGTDTRTYTKK